MNYCYQCVSYQDVSLCRNSRKGFSIVTYYQPACEEFVINPNLKKKTTMDTKICNKCGEEKPFEDFPKYGKGYGKTCKACMKKKPAPVEEPVEVASEDEAPLLGLDDLPEMALYGYSDDDLIAELKARGWTGTLTREEAL